MNKKIFGFILFAVVVFGILLRYIEIDTRSLEYDEIWTMTHYFKCGYGEIFKLLETPNNHPLFTVCAKFLCGIFGEKSWALRAAALCFGIGTLLLVLWWAKRFLYSKYAKIACVALCAFSPYLVHYSNTARGYSMQAFFVAAMVFLLFEYARKPSISKACGVFATAAATLFTVYSGLIFVCAAAGAYLCSFFKWQDWKSELKKNLFLFAAGADFCIVAALWLGLNWEKIVKAQQFGTKISSILQFFQSVGHLIYDLNLTLPLIVVIAALILRPKDRFLRFCMTFAVLTFLSIFATKCGPERVYSPMIAVVLFGAARGLEVIAARLHKIKSINLIMTLILCAPLIMLQTEISRISPPDWGYFVTQIEKNLPKNWYAVYPAGDTYPIYVNYKEAALNLAVRTEKELIMAAFISPEKQKISCLAEDNSEKTLMLPAPAVDFPMKSTFNVNYHLSAYHLAPLDKQIFRKKSSLVAFIVFMPKQQYFAVRRLLYKNDECYIFNAFFNQDFIDNSSRQAVRSIPFFIPEASQDYEYYARMSGAGLKFYILISDDK